MNNYTILNMDKWKRKIHCDVFRNFLIPHYCVSFELNISSFHKYIKNNNLSFSFSLIYLVTKCATEIEEFRYRFLDGNVVLFDKINTSFTYLNSETELFKVVNIEMQDNIQDYIKLAKKTAENQSEYFTGPMGNDIFMFSPLPWITYTHISHTFNGNTENATPIFNWGKYYEIDGKLMMPFSIQVHHSFVDGVHIGKLVGNLQRHLDNINF